MSQNNSKMLARSLNWVCSPGMEMRAKVLRLLGGESRSDLARRADLPISTLSNLINRGGQMGAENALKLARALDVPLEWLVDEAQQWPPPLRGVDMAVEAMALLPAQYRDQVKQVIGSWGDRHRPAVLAAALMLFADAINRGDELGEDVAMHAKGHVSEALSAMVSLDRQRAERQMQDAQTRKSRQGGAGPGAQTGEAAQAFDRAADTTQRRRRAKNRPKKA